MRPIIKWTLWQRRSSILFWTLAVGAFNAISILLYPTLRRQSGGLNHALDSLPQTAKALFTGGGSASLLSPIGYLNGKIFYLFLPLLMAILAINLGASLLAGEESSGTIELILARPISRAKFLLAKAIAGLSIGLVVGGLNVGFIVLLCKSINIGISLSAIAKTGLLSVLLGLLFGSIAYFISALGRLGRAASLGIATAIALGSYLVVSLADIASWLKTPAKILPYNYYHPDSVLAGASPWHAAGGFIIGTLVFGILAWLAFRRRDLA